MQPAPLRCLTIDVEEYFHIEAARSAVPVEDRDRWPARVEANVDLLLALLARHGRRGTFFILGDVARRHPALARRVADAGHEIASHGTGHDRLHRLGPRSFRRDLLDSKRMLEDQTGQAVRGYRAPTFSVVPATSWAIDVLIEAGFAYDASIFPVRHPWYGVPDAPPRPFYVRGSQGGGSLLEVPPLTWAVGGRRLAVAGGGYFRLLPLALMRGGLRQAAMEGRPAVLYFHPWEFDPCTPRMPLRMLNRLRTYTGLGRAARRLERIIAGPARWSSIAEALPELEAQARAGATFCLSA